MTCKRRALKTNFAVQWTLKSFHQRGVFYLTRVLRCAEDLFFPSFVCFFVAKHRKTAEGTNYTFVTTRTTANREAKLRQLRVYARPSTALFAVLRLSRERET